MQWGMLMVWCALAYYGASAPRRTITAVMLAAGLILSMGSQLWLLYLDGQLTLAAGLPLHLCSFSAVVSILLCCHYHATGYHFLLMLGAPGALLALSFPAMVASRYPLAMAIAFYRLHAVIVATAVFFWRQQKPLPTNPRRVFLAGNGLLLFAALANQLTGANYLFLRAAPSGTPLAWLIRPGYAVYAASLEMLCMLLLSWLMPLYRRLDHLRK